MPLDPDVQQLLDFFAAQGPAPEPGSLTPAEMRANLGAAWAPKGPLEQIGDAYDRTIEGAAGNLPARVYVPEGEGPFPLLVWFHGGGWVVGSLVENETACRALCKQGPMVVLSVDYRLAPEHPFPAAADDAYAALCWAAANGGELGADPARLAVAGDSAGGNLAAVAAMMARDRSGPQVALQLLVSPVLGRPGATRSYSDYADGFFMSAASMYWFFEQYPRSEADLDDPYLLPLAATDLAGLPPAYIVEAECDVLRDEGEEYGRRLARAGVPTAVVRYAGQIHGFFGLLDEQIAVAKPAQAAAAEALRQAFAGEFAGEAEPAGAGA